MNKRPKSREETPKEGSDNARSATAPQQYATALHKTQGLLKFFPRDLRRAGSYATSQLNSILYNKINLLDRKPRDSPVL
jgi:hypothetical protein